MSHPTADRDLTQHDGILGEDSIAIGNCPLWLGKQARRLTGIYLLGVRDQKGRTDKLVYRSKMSRNLRADLIRERVKRSQTC